MVDVAEQNAWIEKCFENLRSEALKLIRIHKSEIDDIRKVLLISLSGSRNDLVLKVVTV